MSETGNEPQIAGDPQLHEVTLMLCDLCLDGKGGECHTAGCILWINRAPDLPIRNHPCLISIDGKPGDAYTEPAG